MYVVLIAVAYHTGLIGAMAPLIKTDEHNAVTRPKGIYVTFLASIQLDFACHCSLRDGQRMHLIQDMKIGAH